MKVSLHLTTAAILSALILGAAPGASAQLSASSSFDDFTYQLVDLDPNDGIDPGISFMDTSVGGWAILRDDSGAVRDSAQAGGAGGPILVTVDTADAHLAGTATPTNASSLLYIESGSGEINTDSFLSFVLAPYTQATFSIEARVNASQVDPPNYASASAALNGILWDANGPIIDDSDGLSSYLASSGTLTITLSTAAVERRGYLEFATLANALLQPVPEPGSTAMLVAGLAVLGGFARRRASGKAGMQRIGS